MNEFWSISSLRTLFNSPGNVEGGGPFWPNTLKGLFGSEKGQSGPKKLLPLEFESELEGTGSATAAVIKQSCGTNFEICYS